MAIHHLTVATREHRNLEAEFPDRRAHPIDDGVVLAWIAGGQDQAVDGPNLDFERPSSGHAPSLPASNFSRQQSEENKHQHAVLFRDSQARIIAAKGPLIACLIVAARDLSGFWQVFVRCLAGFLALPDKDLLNGISALLAIWQVWQVF